MDLVYMRDTIEKMPKFHQVAILRIFNENDKVILSENRNGIHINLTEMDQDVLSKVEDYVQYVITQESALDQDEKEKETIKNTYFS